MSIKTEIDRIKQSKVDIISALKSKGVTVPSDASIEDLSALVDAISTSEDLSSELSTQSTLISTQETTIDNIISALQGKASGGSGGGLQEENVNVTLYISSPGSSYRPDISYLTYQNGKFVPKFVDVSTNSYSATLSVAKGSFIAMQTTYANTSIQINNSTGDIEKFTDTSAVYPNIVMAQINGTGQLNVVVSGGGAGGSG